MQHWCTDETTCQIWGLLSALQSVQFSRSVVSDSLRPHELQHARPPCPSPTPGVHPNPCPSSWWCHPAISALTRWHVSVSSETLPCLGPHKSSLSWSSYFSRYPPNSLFFYHHHGSNVDHPQDSLLASTLLQMYKLSWDYFLQPLLNKLMSPKFVSLHPDDLAALQTFISNYPFYSNTPVGRLAFKHNYVFHINTKTETLKKGFNHVILLLKIFWNASPLVLKEKGACY